MISGHNAKVRKYWSANEVTLSIHHRPDQKGYICIYVNVMVTHSRKSKYLFEVSDRGEISN